MNDSICPLQWRYGSEEMRQIFTISSIVKHYVMVEKALVCTLEEYGIAEKGCCELLDKVSFDPKVIYELEKTTGHDIASLVMKLEELTKCRFIHYGATSYDIVDTTWALIIRQALSLVKRRLKEIIDILIDLAKKHRDTLMIGRTHGQHALPITLGFKFANYIYEFSRSLEMICNVEKLVVKGKISGAVGTMASWNGLGIDIEKKTLEKLGLEPHEITTQVVPRDGFAHLISTLAILGSQLDRLALEIRELSRTEISELREGFERIGSSAMPHKVNPVTCEKISGLAKILRGLVIPALENIPLWHERDLTNSSSERILIPHAFLIIDEMLISMIKVLKNLTIDTERMLKNLDLLKGYVLTEAVMNILISKGLSRTEAHKLLRELTRRYGDKVSLKEALMNFEEIRKYLTPDEIEGIDYKNYLGMYNELIDRAINYAMRVMKGL